MAVEYRDVVIGRWRELSSMFVGTDDGWRKQGGRAPQVE